MIRQLRRRYYIAKLTRNLDRYIGRAVRVQLKSGEIREGVLAAVEIDDDGHCYLHLTDPSSTNYEP
jgi:small nuclear ribonucleoprotein (snRNP)-like protein